VALVVTAVPVPLRLFLAVVSLMLVAEVGAVKTLKEQVVQVAGVTLLLVTLLLILAAVEEERIQPLLVVTVVPASSSSNTTSAHLMYSRLNPHRDGLLLLVQ
jgi:hypothetical protein